MGWLERLARIGRTTDKTLHPPWRVGQYVTYVLERDGGSWAAVALRIVGRSEDGAWLIEGGFKAPGGQSMVLFRSDPSGPSEANDLVPVQQGSVRRTPAASHDPANLIDDPLNLISLAMNLFLVRRSKAAIQSLSSDVRHVRYPCGIDQAHLLVTPGPGYQKHHDLSPRVLLTGVACISIDDGKNPMMVTSFGIDDPTATAPTSYDDFVDLSHPKHVEHEGFALTYPATWLLRDESDEGDDELRMTVHSAQVGGVSCSLSCSVTLYRGALDRVRQTRDATRVRLSGSLDGLSPRDVAPLQLPGEAWGTAFDLVKAGVDGVVYAACCSTDSGDRFALITMTGCVARASPRRAEMLAAYEQALRAIVESFRFRTY